MSLKNNLKSNQVFQKVSKRIKEGPKFFKGQIAMEYFILFSIIAVLTLLSFTTFHRDIASIIQGQSSNSIFGKAIEKIGEIQGK